VDPAQLIKHAKSWESQYQGGNMWGSWDCYLTAYRDILGLQLPEHEKYAAWETLAIESGFRFLHSEFALVCDFPEILKVDDRNRPHCADGPSHRWRDGWSLYHWHGVRVPDYIIEQPDTITIQSIREEQNTEVRRVMVERYGYERYIRDAGLQLIAKCADDDVRVGLRSARLFKDDTLILLDMLNSTPEPDGTTKRYVLPIDPAAYNGRAGLDCLAAMASTWRKRSDPTRLYFKQPEDYAPMIET
jgi:hypothetical protein